MKARVRRMFEVKSDMIHKIGFDSQTPGVDHGCMVVQFANFKAYIYNDVSWSDFLQLMNAPSIGAAFNLLIRDKYKGELITPKDTHLVEQTALTKLDEVVVTPRGGGSEPSGELPFLDVMGVDSSSKVGKVSSVRRKK